MHCSAFMERLAISIALVTSTFIRQSKMGSTLAFPQRKWLRERATTFRYTYIAFLVFKCEGSPIILYFRGGNRRRCNDFLRECQSIESS
jgi:hypothetical protein